MQALYDAADDDSATGGPDLTRRIFPVVATITADGFERLPTRTRAGTPRPSSTSACSCRTGRRRAGSWLTPALPERAQPDPISSKEAPAVSMPFYVLPNR